MVLFISIDGVRPDAIQAATTPTFDTLQKEGSYSFLARSVMPSITLPCHMSIFHSVPPERHNILSNTYTPMVRPVPGLIELLAQAGKTTASYFSWEPLRDISRPSSLSHMDFSAYANDYEISDDRIVKRALPYLKAASFDFNFLYLGSADECGHVQGWMSESYLKQVEHLDTLIGSVLECLPSNTTVLIHSDHGGHERMHGTAKDEDMLIPWFLWGKGVRQNHEVSTSIGLLDTAPTIAYLLNVPAPSVWEGKVIREAFITDNDTQA